MYINQAISRAKKSPTVESIAVSYLNNIVDVSYNIPISISRCTPALDSSQTWQLVPVPSLNLVTVVCFCHITGLWYIAKTNLCSGVSNHLQIKFVCKI